MQTWHTVINKMSMIKMYMATASFKNYKIIFFLNYVIFFIKKLSKLYIKKLRKYLDIGLVFFLIFLIPVSSCVALSNLKMF